MAKPGGTKRKPNMQDSTLRLHRAVLKRIVKVEREVQELKAWQKRRDA